MGTEGGRKWGRGRGLREERRGAKGGPLVGISYLGQWTPEGVRTIENPVLVNNVENFLTHSASGSWRCSPKWLITIL